jgi:hypothetical protein
MAMPVAALNLVPAAAAVRPPADVKVAPTSPYYTWVEGSVANSLASAGEAVATAESAVESAKALAVRSGGNSIVTSSNGQMTIRSDAGDVITVMPADSHGRRRTVVRSADGAEIAFADANAVPGLAAAFAAPPFPPPPPRPPHTPKSAIDRAIELKAVGVTPEYVASIRSAAPQLRLDHDDIVDMKAVGVTPSFINELARLGYRNVNADDIVDAYAVGVRESYVRDLAAAGYGRLSLDQLTELKAVGVSAGDIERFRRAGYDHIDVEKLTELKALGITPEELRASERYGGP